MFSAGRSRRIRRACAERGIMPREVNQVRGSLVRRCAAEGATRRSFAVSQNFVAAMPRRMRRGVRDNGFR
jgi:hypothetical protein